MIERDYILTHIVETLALLPAPDGLIFKGGTALRLCFFADFRYSADLDFSLVGLPVEAVLELVQRALEDVKARIGIPHLELVDGPPREIQYKGPLGRERRIKLDIADDELVIETQATALIGRYSDQSVPPPSITTYTLSEVVAEKLRCVIQRVQCRDPFDLHRLLVEQGIEMQDAWPLFEQKAEHKGLDPDSFDGRFDEREPMYRRRWTRELSEHVSDVPHFERTMRELRRELRNRR